MAIINFNSISGINTVSVASSIIIGDSLVITSAGIENANDISSSGIATFNNVKIGGVLYDTHTNVGAGDSVLISTGIGVSWIDVATAALQGVQGTQGVQGIQGTQGVQGTQGLQGTQGVQGVQGIQGTQGVQGTQGLQGTQGVQGTGGTQGTFGTQGIQGAIGPSTQINASDETSDTSLFPVMVTAAGSNQTAVVGVTRGFQYNASNGNLGVGVAPGAPLHIVATGGSTNSINIGLIVDYEATAAEAAGGGVGILFRGKSAGGGSANYNQAQIVTNNDGTNNSHGLSFYFKPNAATALTEAFRLTNIGHLEPSADNTRNLGASDRRWANVYTADLQMSNEGSQNDIDGTWGKYTIQEGENDLFLINRRTGKKYAFVLREVE